MRDLNLNYELCHFYCCCQQQKEEKKSQNLLETKTIGSVTREITTITDFFFFFFSLSFLWLIATADVRVKRQDDDDNAEVNVEELCQDRPADEYFRLSADGDCRDVVR